MLSVLVSESDSKLYKWQLRVLTAIRGRIETAMNFSYWSQIRKLNLFCQNIVAFTYIRMKRSEFNTICRIEISVPFFALFFSFVGTKFHHRMPNISKFLQDYECAIILRFQCLVIPVKKKLSFPRQLITQKKNIQTRKTDKKKYVSLTELSTVIV